MSDYIPKNEKEEKLIEAWRLGYDGRAAFNYAGITFQEWTNIASEELYECYKQTIEEFKRNFEGQFSSVSRDRSNKTIVFDPIKQNFTSIDFNDYEEVKAALFKSISSKALTYPEDNLAAKNAIQFLSLMEKSREFQSQNRNPNQFYVDFKTFIKVGGFPEPYQKQIEMCDFLNKPGIKLLLAARDYGKTDYGVICRIAYRIATIPDYSCMIITKEGGRSKNIGQTISQLCKDNGVVFAKDSATEGLRVTTKFGKEDSLFCTSINTSAFRGHHVDEIIMDDPINNDDKYSAASRLRAKEIYDECTNLSPNICIIGQPVHRNDLYNVLARGAKGLDADGNKIDAEEEVQKMANVKIMEMPHGTIPERDKDLDHLRAIGVQEENIQANYFLKTPSLDRTPFAECEIINNFNAKDTCVWIDPSYIGGDYTALCVAGLFMESLQVRGYLWVKPWYELINEFTDIIELCQPKRVFFETNNLGENPILLLKEKGYSAIGVRTKVNKLKKIKALACFSNSIKLYQIDKDPNATMAAKKYMQENHLFNQEFRDWEDNGRYDDANDAVSSLALKTGLISVKDK